MAEEKLKEFEKHTEEEHERSEKVSVKTYCKIAQNYAEQIYVKTYNEFRNRESYYDAFIILWHIIKQCGEHGSTNDKIISCVDPDFRVAHKTRATRKAGCKNHIIIDEESEIILASEQIPFNVGDEKKLINLIEKVEDKFKLKSEEISADKVYGTINNRAYLKDNKIITNIAFSDNSNKEYAKFDISKFDIAEDLSSALCPNG